MSLVKCDTLLSFYMPFKLGNLIPGNNKHETLLIGYADISTHLSAPLWRIPITSDDKTAERYDELYDFLNWLLVWYRVLHGF